MTVENPPKLTSELDYWEVRLKNGGTISLRAHGVVERGDHFCFVALMIGTPAYEYELVRISKSDVESYEGGWPEPPLR